MFLGESAYRPKEPQPWFNDLRDYLVGRNPGLDKFFRWIEQQTSEIRHDDDHVMLDCAPHKVISQQL